MPLPYQEKQVQPAPVLSKVKSRPAVELLILYRVHPLCQRERAWAVQAVHDEADSQ